MSIYQTIKNYIGNRNGYMRCPISGDTFWNNEPIKIPYTIFQSILISKKLLSTYSKNELAKKVHERIHRPLPPNTKHIFHGKPFSIEEIAEEIPNN